MNQRRNEIANKYHKHLKNTILTFQHIPGNIFCNYHIFAAKVYGSRKKFMDYLEKFMIQTNIYYLIPQHLQKANLYLGYRRGDFPIAELICNKIVALPMYPELTDGNLQKVINIIKSY